MYLSADKGGLGLVHIVNKVKFLLVHSILCNSVENRKPCGSLLRAYLDVSLRNFIPEVYDNFLRIFKAPPVGILMHLFDLHRLKKIVTPGTQ